MKRHYGDRLCFEFNVDEHDPHHAEGLALFERLTEPKMMKRVAKLKDDLEMGTDRIDIFIEPQEPGVWGYCRSMSDHYMKGIYLMPGPWHDDEHPLKVLTHELLHACVASHLTGWQAAMRAGVGGQLRQYAEAAGHVAARGEEKLVQLLTELLWRRLT